MIRFFTAVALIVGAFVAPWWAVGIGILICVLAYRSFLEALVPALVLDILHGASPIAGIPAIITLSVVALLIFSFLIEGRLRNHVRI